MGKVPNRISQKAFRNTLKGVTRGSLPNRAYKALQEQGLGKLRYKQSLSKREVAKAFSALKEHGGVMKQTGMRAAGFVSRATQKQQDLTPQKAPTVNKEQQQKVARLKNEAAQSLLDRRNMNKDLDLRKFRQSIHSESDRKVNEANKSVQPKKKTGYERPAMVPTSSAAIRGGNFSMKRSTAPSEEILERNVGTLEQGLNPSESTEEISIGDQVTLTEGKITALKNSGDMDAYPTTTGIVNDIYRDGYSVDFGGSTKRIKKEDVVLSNAPDKQTADEPQKNIIEEKPADINDEDDSENQPEDMFI